MQGFGEACLYTGAAAWAVEVAGIHRSGQALGYIASGIWGGIAAGPVVGQWLGSFERAAMMQVAAALVAFVVLARVPEEYTPHPHSGKRRWLPGHMIGPGIAIGLVNVHYPVITGFLVLHLARYGNSGPAAFSAYALLILVSRFFLGGLPDRMRPTITYYGGLVAMAIGLLALAWGPPPMIAVAAAAMLGFGFSFPWSSIATTVLRKVPSGERGSAVGVLSAFVDLFVGASSFVAGAVANRFGYPPVFLVAASSLAAAAIVGRYVFAGNKAAKAAVVGDAVYTGESAIG